ncbi:hypothetical protein H5410_040342 [Solanum commersonii]|uniref:Uncharacterized protein n=1 Tax=Solanum commersonii TaxID=4109 RepID=A0A9J5XR41_SOLCO|nr:hypothetical protein H5410_040342 [Solanum commersonii]
MELLCKRSVNDIFKFKRIKKRRYGRSAAMDLIIIKARRMTYNKSFEDRIYFKIIINQIL